MLHMSLGCAVTGSRSFVLGLFRGPVVFRLFVILFLVSVQAHAATASPDDTGRSPGGFVTEDVDAQEVPSPPKLIKRPKTVPDLLSNLVHIVKHDLIFQKDFYSDKSLTRLLGATHIDGDRNPSDIALVVHFVSMPNYVVISDDIPVPVPGGGALIRRNSTGFSIHVHIDDPADRPTYDTVERILGRSWKAWEPSVPSPHRRYVAPTAPHGNADMFVSFRTPLADNGFQAIFFADAKLHDFIVRIHPNERN